MTHRTPLQPFAFTVLYVAPGAAAQNRISVKPAGGTPGAPTGAAVIGTTATHQDSLPINPVHGSVFLRLTYP